MPQFPDDVGFCYYHGQQYRERVHAKEAGRQISRFLETEIMTACDLSCTLSALFGATAEGYIKPKRATTLAYLASLMLQTHKLARQEYQETFQKTWPDVVYDAPAFNPLDDEPGSPILASAPIESQSASADSPAVSLESAGNATESQDPVEVEEQLDGVIPFDSAT